MVHLVNFAFILLEALIQLFIYAMIASAILSWLVAFNVVNVRHPLAYNVVRFLDAVTRPVLRPVQRIIPPLGGIDISPIIVILVLSIGSSTLLRPLHEYVLLQLVGR